MPPHLVIQGRTARNLDSHRCKDISGHGLKLVHCWRLFRKSNPDVLHLLRTQNVARLTGIGEGGVLRNGG